MLSAIHDYKKTKVDETDKAIERLSRETARLKGRIDKAYDDYRDGLIDKDTWQRAHQRHSAQLAEDTKRIQQLQKPGSNLYDHAERLITTAMKVSSQFSTGNPDKKRSILKSCVSNCTMTSGNLHHDYKKPFDIIAEGSRTSNWWS